MSTPVEPIVIEGRTEADPAWVWRVLTEPSEVARWFAEVTPVDGIGSPYRIDFGDGSLIDGTVRELVPGRRLAYTWRWEGEEPVQVTRVAWEVGPIDGGGSRIEIRHDGWAEAGADEATRDEHATYWEDYMAGLIELLDADAEDRDMATGGLGLPKA